MARQFFYFILYLLVASCVDRLTFDTGGSIIYPIAIEGQVTDQPGPYTVRISRSFDIESRINIKQAISAQSVVISDNAGNIETLTETSPGVYQTRSGGLRGQVGRVYTLNVELLDGRIYQSYPDTLLSGGSIDSLYYNFTSEQDINGQPLHGFDIYFNASNSSTNRSQSLWKFTRVFQAETTPQNADVLRGGCNPIGSKCNFKPPCSGLVNIANPAFPPSFEEQGPCTCCKCWYFSNSTIPILSDETFLRNGKFQDIKISRVPVEAWIFQDDKVYIQVAAHSLSQRAYRFWKAIRDQKIDVNSLFQPISGRIPRNFVQASGESQPIDGIFYTSQVISKSAFIQKYEVPRQEMIPATPEWNDSCLTLFPAGTTERPPFWF